MKKKILIVIDNLNGGGAEKVLVNLLKKLDSKKFIIDLQLIEKEGVYLNDIKVNKIMSVFEKRPKLNRIIFIKKLISLIRKPKIYLFRKGYLKNKENYDVEIAFLEGLTTEYISNKKSNSKKIAWIHTDLKRHSPKYYSNSKYENLDKIICVSNDAKNSFCDLFPSLEKKVQVIYNPIFKSEILKNSLEDVEGFDNEVNILTVARLTEAKGVDILLKAHKILILKGLKYKLKILGQGELEKHYKKYIVDNKLENYTELLGFKKNPYPYIKNSDIIVVPSRYEGFSLVVAESLVLKKAIISTKCSGPIEILENGKYGKLVEIENIEELAQAMEEFILNKNIRYKYEEFSKKRANIFEENKIIKEIEELLNES